MSGLRYPRGNTVIAGDSYVMGYREIDKVPGCICATYFYVNGMRIMYAVVRKKNGKTEIKLGSYKNKFIVGPKTETEVGLGSYKRKFVTKPIIETDILQDVVNIFSYSRDEHYYFFSNSEGILLVLDEQGNTKERPDYIPQNTIGILDEYVVLSEGTVINLSGENEIKDRIVGYRIHYPGLMSMWSEHKIYRISGITTKELSIYNYSNRIDDFHTDEYSVRDGSVVIILMILSEGTIRIKFVYKGKIMKKVELDGRWYSAPFITSGRVYAVDAGGVIRDIRCAWNGYQNFFVLNNDWRQGKVSPDMLYSTERSLFEQGIKKDNGSISVHHGMRVFSPMKGKNARKR